MGSTPGGPVRVRWGRRERLLPAGVPLAAAVAEGGPPVLQRSVRYHRPRAPYCGIGACTGCLVRVNGVPNVRACRYVPQEGDRIATENAWPSTRFDLLAALDLLFPGGIDSVRGFRRPAFARPIYQRVVRRLAAFGALPDPPGAVAPGSPAALVEVDVAVVGAGPVGRAAAARLLSHGLHPLLIDRGSIRDVPTGVDRLDRHTVIFLPPPRAGERPFDLLAAPDSGPAVRIATSRVLLATGAYDAGLWFRNGDRPGVLTAEGAESLERPDRGPPFHRGLLFGGGRRAAGLLSRWGDRFDAVVAPGSISPDIARIASENGVPLYPRSLLLEALGRRRVRGARIRTRGGGPTTTLDADAIVLAHRQLPHGQLLFQVGARMNWGAFPGAYYPVQVDGATTVPGLAVAGGVALGPDRSGGPASGESAADRLASDSPWPGRFPDPTPEPPSEMEGYYRELLGTRGRGGRWTACACEDVGIDEIDEAHRRGYRGLEVVKRYTGVGTGLCQGRYCLPETILMLSIAEGRPPSEVGYITQRPPVLPVPLESLAALPERTGDP